MYLFMEKVVVNYCTRDSHVWFKVFQDVEQKKAASRPLGGSDMIHVSHIT